MECKILNDLMQSNGYLVLSFDELLAEAPYVKRPIRFWFDTPHGRIQITAGSCEVYCTQLIGRTYLMLSDIELRHDAYEYPNDFTDKIIKSGLTEGNTITYILSKLKLAGLKADVYQDKEETKPLEIYDVWFSINGKHVPFDVNYQLNPPKCG